MTEDSKKTLGNVVQIDEKRINDHLGELVRGTVEETLNGLLDAEADALCGAQRYERSPDRTELSGRQLRAQAAHQGRRGDARDAQAAQSGIRDGDH